MKFFIALMIIINTVIFILGGFFFMLLLALALGPAPTLLLHILLIMMLYLNACQPIKAWRGKYQVSPLSFYLNSFLLIVFLLIFAAPVAFGGNFHIISKDVYLFVYISTNIGLALWMRKKHRDSLNALPSLTG